jgi:hypothetical protein
LSINGKGTLRTPIRARLDFRSHGHGESLNMAVHETARFSIFPTIGACITKLTQEGMDARGIRDLRSPSLSSIDWVY